MAILNKQNLAAGFSSKIKVSRSTTVEEVNDLLKRAAEKELKDILGYKVRLLVSIDYKTDSRFLS